MHFYDYMCSHICLNLIQLHFLTFKSVQVEESKIVRITVLHLHTSGTAVFVHVVMTIYSVCKRLLLRHATCFNATSNCTLVNPIWAIFMMNFGWKMYPTNAEESLKRKETPFSCMVKVHAFASDGASMLKRFVHRGKIIKFKACSPVCCQNVVSHLCYEVSFNKALLHQK